MPRTLLIVGAVVVLAVAAIVEGRFSNRWGNEDLKGTAAKLNNVPIAFGDWTSTENPIKADVLKKAEAVNSVSRVYENKNARTQVSVLMLCGPSGPIGAHTPDICYAGLGFKMHRREIRKTVGDSSYWTGRFEKPNGDSNLMVSWAWGVEGTWSAAENPRFEFAGRQSLYKLYVTRGLTLSEKVNEPTDVDPTQDFLKDFLPEVKKALAQHGTP